MHSGFVVFYFGEVYGNGRSISDFAYRFEGEGEETEAVISWKTDECISSKLHLPASLSKGKQGIEDTLNALKGCLVTSEVEMIFHTT